MGNIITAALVGLIAVLLFKQAKKHDFVISFLCLTVLGLIVGYILWVDYSPVRELPMYLGLGLFMSYFILGTLLYFKLIKTNRKRVLYSFVICIACIIFRIAFTIITRDSMGSGGKFAAEIKFFDLSTSIVTIATILFFLTALVISTYNVIEGWLASRSFLHVQSKAESGDVEAKNNLGLMYVMGQGVEQDFKVAMDLFNKAADQGEVNAQNNLGMMHADGQGVEQNYVTAYAWASIAEVNGGEAAKQNKSILAKEMNHKQITEAEEFVKEMIRKNPKLIKNKITPTPFSFSPTSPTQSSQATHQ